MMDEGFAQGSSFLYRRDPRGKLVAALIFTVTIALVYSFTALCVAFIFSFCLLIAGRIQRKQLFKRILVINGFSLFFWITLPITYGGNETIVFGPFLLSLEGIRIAALITLKTNVIVTALIALIATSTVVDIGHALNKLHIPNKLVCILLFSYRYVFVIHQEYERLQRAAKIRAFRPATSLHTYKTYAYLFGMTLVKSYNRSQRVHQAMLLRGFNGQLISLKVYTFTAADFLLIVASSLASSFLVVLSL